MLAIAPATFELADAASGRLAAADVAFVEGAMVRERFGCCGEDWINDRSRIVREAANGVAWKVGERRKETPPFHGTPRRACFE